MFILIRLASSMGIDPKTDLTISQIREMYLPAPPVYRKEPRVQAGANPDDPVSNMLGFGSGLVLGGLGL